MPMRHLLIVEADEFVQRLLAAYLQREGFRVSLAVSAREALALLSNEAVNLVLLDLGLPDEDGLALLRQLRTRSEVPVVVLTARKDRADRLTALQLGADDYLTKPCDPDELALRLRNLLRRSDAGAGSGEAPPGTARLYFAGWTMDLDGHNLLAPNARAVHLTHTEFNLLSAFTRAPNRVLTRSQLLDAIVASEDVPSDRMIDVVVSRLRKKLERDPNNPRLITTVVGLGYKFSAPVSRTPPERAG